jgi:hypothetical protein
MPPQKILTLEEQFAFIQSMTETIRDNPNQVELQNALLSTMTYIPRFTESDKKFLPKDFSEIKVNGYVIVFPFRIFPEWKKAGYKVWIECNSRRCEVNYDVIRFLLNPERNIVRFEIEFKDNIVLAFLKEYYCDWDREEQNEIELAWANKGIPISKEIKNQIFQIVGQWNHMYSGQALKTIIITGNDGVENGQYRVYSESIIVERGMLTSEEKIRIVIHHELHHHYYNWLPEKIPECQTLLRVFKELKEILAKEEFDDLFAEGSYAGFAAGHPRDNASELLASLWNVLLFYNAELKAKMKALMISSPSKAIQINLNIKTFADSFKLNWEMEPRQMNSIYKLI